MTLRKREHPKARTELRAAAQWYERQRTGLGNEFYDTVDAAVTGAIDWPDAGSPYPGLEGDPLIRTKRVPRYPYRIVYFIEGDELIVFAYAHDKRQPGYWAHHLGD